MNEGEGNTEIEGNEREKEILCIIKHTRAGEEIQRRGRGEKERREKERGERERGVCC